MALTDLPLFPLSAVLFPGGPLVLRIFERRYLDLVRDCARRGSGFGVCLILQGREVGEAAVPAAVGTLARITDFYTLQDGLLGITAEGGERFQVATTRVRDNGLVHGEVRFWPDEPTVAVPPEHALLATILERLIEKAGGPFANAERSCYDDCELGWFPSRRDAAAGTNRAPAAAAGDRSGAAARAPDALCAAIPARLSARWRTAMETP